MLQSFLSLICIFVFNLQKLQLKLECEQEIERVHKKYDGLIKDDEAGFHQDKKILETIYNKVLVNQILAEEFRAKFIDTKGGPSASFQGMKFRKTQRVCSIVNLHCKVNLS